jgi:hypothetical protein
VSTLTLINEVESKEERTEADFVRRPGGCGSAFQPDLTINVDNKQGTI